jgi:glucose-1-phosphatase
MTKIKNLLFDLGGVLLNIDYNKTAGAFKKLGVAQFDEMYSQAGANILFESLETGKISEPDFYTDIRQYCNPSVTQQQIEAAWNAILVNFRKDSLACLEELAKKYNLYLLSNTNSIHFTAFHKMFREETGKADMDDYFIKSYYSHKIHMRKPYTDTYHFVMNDAGITAAETLFIDDSIVNIEGAEKAGLKVHHLKTDQKIEDITL